MTKVKGQMGRFSLAGGGLLLSTYSWATTLTLTQQARVTLLPNMKDSKLNVILRPVCNRRTESNKNDCIKNR